jgi:hypothetical protein
MLDTHTDPAHTFILTIDKASLESARCNPALQIAIAARCLAFGKRHETARLDGYHYMKRTDEPKRCASTN